MNVSTRLETIASFVPEGSNIADIGTDHGYVPIYLAERGVIAHGIAMDVRPGPLSRARAHIRDAGLADRIETRLSDGLKGLSPGEADCVIIAGMGGALMIHILEEGRRLWDSIGKFVLSPQSEIDKVRLYLESQEFSIIRERMIQDDGKYYTVMGVAQKTIQSGRAGRESKDEAGDTPWRYYRYGRRLIAENDPVLFEYLQSEGAKLTRLLEELSGRGSERARQRQEELARELKWNKETQDEMRGNDQKTGTAGACGLRGGVG